MSEHSSCNLDDETLFDPISPLPNPQSDFDKQKCDLVHTERWIKAKFRFSDYELQKTEEPFETFNAYTVGLKKFIEAHIAQNINLNMNNDINKIKITISNLSHNYNSSNLYDEPYLKKIEKIGNHMLHIQSTRL